MNGSSRVAGTSPGCGGSCATKASLPPWFESAKASALAAFADHLAKDQDALIGRSHGLLVPVGGKNPPKTWLAVCIETLLPARECETPLQQR